MEDKLIIEIWENSSGKCPVLKFTQKQAPKDIKKIDRKIQWLKNLGIKKMLNSQHVKYLKGSKKKYGHKLYELRPDRYRIIFTIIDNTALLIHGFIKKTNYTPQKEVNKANKRIYKYKNN